MSPSLSAHHADATAYPAWRRRTVRGDGVDLGVLEAGDPRLPTVVLVHGWPDTHRVWLPVAARLAPFAHVVLYDTRGQGLSPTSAPAADFVLPRLADDLRAVLEATSPDRPAHLVGHDWGSVQAWEAVCEPWAPDRVASFTSLSGPNLDHVGAWARASLRRPSPARIAGLIGQAVSSAYVPFLVSPAAPVVLGAVGHADAVSGLGYYQANLLHGARPRERRTAVPVLQVELTRDPAIRHASLAASDPWCDDLRRTPLRAGHGAPRTHPDLVAGHVLDHLDEVLSRRRSPRPRRSS